MSTDPSWELVDKQRRRISELEVALKSAQNRLTAIGLIGTVYVYPKEWDHSGMGGGPSIEDYDKIDLSQL